MSPPNVVDTQARQRVVGDDETKSETFERNYIPMDFTIKEIRDAIPAHLFVRNTTKSIVYLLKDVATIASLVYCAILIDTLPFLALRIIAWIAYSIVQGTVMVGLFILAHECGHGAFSDNRTINTVVGWVIDSAYLVPYHTFQIAHFKHHKGTSSMTKDIDYVPLTRSKRSSPAMIIDGNAGSHDHHDHHDCSIFADTPLYNLSSLVSFLITGWPLYVLTNIHGYIPPKWIVAHFQPVPPQYEPHQRKGIFYSNCGVALMATTLLFFSAVYGAWTVFMLYVAPYLVLNVWLVCITYLQHTDPKVPHFRDQAWNFQRGAACTVDRSFGAVVNHLHHHISATHQCHHMFTQMPFYNAVEATKYLKEKLGKYYIYDETPIVQALIRNWRECKFVEDEGDVVFYKS
ncbi:Acyl-lipid omega-3 desaturase [Podila epicladia]|nr:Acyl-lipid omega-3 desaturase [Podila epicladia]KAG0087889.1 Acyl-lipid omega-3 desaturase [Podila epicladia]